ncbi:hypothetical protein BRADI_1g77075v3 [Brachypodium distachyon]|uniref:Uncharacterized protein n=1 Tax=Brachypodium distachyon TaxID=15368 RepID=A0A2K2DVJ4_BRADI|nr:hypothetical protein BRADI_1g77075v3 [Brachypodium distachyon]
MNSQNSEAALTPVYLDFDHLPCLNLTYRWPHTTHVSDMRWGITAQSKIGQMIKSAPKLADATLHLDEE